MNYEYLNQRNIFTPQYSSHNTTNDAINNINQAIKKADYLSNMIISSNNFFTNKIKNMSMSNNSSVPLLPINYSTLTFGKNTKNSNKYIKFPFYFNIIIC